GLLLFIAIGGAIGTLRNGFYHYLLSNSDSLFARMSREYIPHTLFGSGMAVGVICLIGLVLLVRMTTYNQLAAISEGKSQAIYRLRAGRMLFGLFGIMLV